VRVFLAPASAFSALRGAMIDYRRLRGVWQKLRWLAELCFAPTLAEHHLILLPSSFSFLYYLLRPLRLTCKWAWRFLQAMLPGDRPLEPGLRARQARSAFASAWQSLAVKVHDLAACCLRPTAYCLQLSGRTLDFGPWTLDLGRWTLALAPNVILRNARRFPRAPAALLYLLIGLLCILSLRAAFNTAPVSLMAQVRPEARLDQDGFSLSLAIGLPAGVRIGHNLCAHWSGN